MVVVSNSHILDIGVTSQCGVTTRIHFRKIEFAKKMNEEDIATLEDLFSSFIESSEEEPNDSTEPLDSWTFAGADESRDFFLSDVAISETLLSKVKDEIETVYESIRRRLNRAHNDDITEDDVINLCLS